MNNHIQDEHLDELCEFKKQEVEDRNRAKRRYTDREVQRRAADASLVRVLATANLPFRLTKNKYFVKFCSELNSEYIPPSPDAIKRTIQIQADEYLNAIRTEMSSVQKCWLTLDGWDYKNAGAALYAYFFIYATPDFQRRHCFAGVWPLIGRATAEQIGELTVKVLDKFDVSPSKVVGIVTDAASNIVSFAGRNNFYHIHCQSHALSLIIEKIAKNARLSSSLAKVNGLANHLSRSKTDREKFKEMSSKLNNSGRLPIPFSETRWGGVVMLVQSYLNHKSSLTSSPALQKFTASPQEIRSLEEFLEFGTPFISALTHAESDSSFASESLVQLGALEKRLSGLTTCRMISDAKAATAEKSRKSVDGDILLMCTLLDARLAYSDGITAHRTWEEAENLIMNYSDDVQEKDFPQHSPSPHQSPKRRKSEGNIIAEFLQDQKKQGSSKTIKEELIEYRASIQLSRPEYTRSSTPLDFWKANSTTFPLLSRVANHLVVAPQSSAQTERLFSKCKNVVASPKRNRLKSATLNSILLSAALAELEDKNCSSEDSHSDAESDENSDNEEAGTNIQYRSKNSLFSYSDDDEDLEDRMNKPCTSSSFAPTSPVMSRVEPESSGSSDSEEQKSPPPLRSCAKLEKDSSPTLPQKRSVRGCRGNRGNRGLKKTPK